MATKNLDELKDKLYRAFDIAMKYGEDDLVNYSTNDSHQAGAQALLAAAAAAQAINAIQREQREAGEQKVRILPKQ